MPALRLALRPTEIPTGTPLPDDYRVALDGRTIGRIMKVQRAGGAVAWFWSFLIFPNSPADRGDAESLDAAKAAFRARVEAVGPFDPATVRRE